MATGGGGGDSLEAVFGSEAVFEHVCQLCRDDEKIREAVGYCVDCAEWLCNDCFRIHTRPRPTRYHVLKDIDEMKNSTSPIKATDKCTEKCDQHNGKRFKYYCHVHDFLGCSVCIIQSHGACKVDHIPDVCESADIKDEFQQVTEKLVAVAKESKHVINEVNTVGQTMLKTMKIETVGAFRSYIKKVKESLDEAGNALEEACEKKANVESERLSNVTKQCEAVEKESNIIRSHLEVLQSTGQHCNVFVALKRSKDKLATLERDQKAAQLTSSVIVYNFQPNKAMEMVIAGSDRIGTLVEQRSRNDRDYSKMQARHVADISIKSTGNKTCCITGSALLSPEKLVLSDRDNMQVKVINTRTNKIISNYNVDGKPWGICRTSDTSCVVTVYDKQIIQFLSVDLTDNITMTKKINVKGHCRGVAWMGDKLLVTYIDPEKTEILTIGGSVLQKIKNRRVVKMPYYAACNQDRTSVYISNYNNNTVTCMSLDGTLIATYTDPKLRGPEQIAIDSNGMVFVACRGSKNVHLLTPDCIKVKVILDESDVLKEMFVVSYCEQTNRLYIGMNMCDVIQVFQLS